MGVGLGLLIAAVGVRTAEGGKRSGECGGAGGAGSAAEAVSVEVAWWPVIWSCLFGRTGCYCLIIIVEGKLI